MRRSGAAVGGAIRLSTVTESCRTGWVFSLGWWRVFRRANAAHLGHNGDHERSPRVVPSAQDAARRGRVQEGMHRITPWGARAPQSGTSCISLPGLLTLHEGETAQHTSHQFDAYDGVRPPSGQGGTTYDDRH